jgi:hypothetical protein
MGLMTKSQAVRVRMIGACFPIAMLAIVMLDVGGQPFRADALFPHYWFGRGFGCIPAGFVLAGIAGIVVVAPSLGARMRLLLIGQALLNGAMLLEIGLEATFRSYRHLEGSTALGISLAIYLLLYAAVRQASKYRPQPERLEGSPYPR